jgi:hypothetical protein
VRLLGLVVVLVLLGAPEARAEPTGSALSDLFGQIQ